MNVITGILDARGILQVRAMPPSANQQSVLALLENLNGLDHLKELFWNELNYERINEPISRRGWGETAAKARRREGQMALRILRENGPSLPDYRAPSSSHRAADDLDDGQPD